MEVTKCLFHDKGLPKIVWVEVVNTTIFLLNRLPIKPLQNKTQFETWNDYKPKLFNLKTFDYFSQVKRKKLDKKAKPKIFVGYNWNSRVKLLEKQTN